MTPRDAEPLLAVENLTKTFGGGAALLGRKHATVRAVDDISFEIGEGETLGLVGESGSGKSTTGYSVLQLLKPTGGSVRFMGKELTTMSRNDLREIRREMQIVFQDPYSSLNPRMTVGNIVSEPLTVHGVGTRRSREASVRSPCSSASIFPIRTAGSTITRTSSRAACGSAPSSPWRSRSGRGC